MAGPPGQMDFSDVKIQVVRTLKGQAKEKLPVWIDVRKLPPEAKEATPEAGKQYLFLIRQTNPASPHVIKILRPAPDQVRAVQQALPEPPPAKKKPPQD